MDDRTLSRWLDDVAVGKGELADKLDPVERRVLRKALEELARTGRCATYEDLWKIDFHERPPTPEEFLYDGAFLGSMGTKLWPEWKRDLEFVLDPANEIVEWILDGAIGTGKTTAFDAGLMYHFYRLCIMKNPQEHFELLDGSPIVVAFFNVFKYLSEDTTYASFMSMMHASPVLKEIYRKSKEPRKTRGDDFQFHQFPNNIGLVTGSKALNALGQNVVMGAADEVNFRKRSARRSKDELGATDAFELYTAVRKRIESRIGSPVLLGLISSSKDEYDFTESHKQRQKDDPHTYHSRYSIYGIKKERYGSEPTFRVYVGDKINPPRILDEDEMLGPTEEGHIEHVPISFRGSYELNIVGAIRDVSGLAVSAFGKLLRDKRKALDAVDTSRPNPFTRGTVECGVHDPMPIEAFFERDKLFKQIDVQGTRFRPLHYPLSARFIHIDLAKNQCAAGIACCCPAGRKSVFRHDSTTDQQDLLQEMVVHFDFFLQIVNVKGQRIDYAKIRQFIVALRNYGLPIHRVTFDQYQSVDSINLLEQQGIRAGDQSVEKTMDPYRGLANGLMEGRVSVPFHEVFLSEIVSVEVYDEGNKEKVYPGSYGSKDVADCAAAAMYRCMSEGVISDSTSASALEIPGALERLRTGSDSKPIPASPLDRIFQEFD